MGSKAIFYAKLYFSVRTKTLQQRMLNKYDFFLNIFCDLILQLATVVFFYALFTNIPSIQGWEYHEVLLIYGLFQLSYGVFGFLFWALYDFGNILVSGTFDGALMRPVSSLFLQLSKGMSDIGGLVLGGCLIGYSIWNGTLHLSALNLLMLAVFLVCGITLFACFYTLIASVNFWMENSSRPLLNMFSLCTQFARYPLTIYQRSIKILFTWVLPLGFIGFYPASFFLQKDWRWSAMLLPVVALGFVFLTRMVWRMGLRRYRGAGN